MTDETRLREERARGEHARQILDDPLIREAFDKIEATITDAWKSSRADEEEQRRNAYLTLRLLNNLRAEFTRAVSTGELAAKQLLTIKDDGKLKRMLKRV